MDGDKRADAARVADVTALAERVFGDEAVAREWLHARNPALGNEAPIHILGTGSGAELVEAVLNRIEYGVYE